MHQPLDLHAEADMAGTRSLLHTLVFAGSLSFLTLLPVSLIAQSADIRGKVTDETWGTVAGAELVLHTTQGAPVQETRSASDGTFAFRAVPSGSYWLKVTAEHFEGQRLQLDLNGELIPALEILLGLAKFGSEITVTAERGMVADVQRTAPIVTVRDEFRRQPLPTIGNALTGAVGVMIQQSTYGQVSPFLRGLTGYQVLNVIDGVRFNNSTFRSGPNQYLAFADPSQVERVEAVLGPSSSQFGSDSMGGTIQLLTPAAQFSDVLRFRPTGTVSLLASGADRSGGGDTGVFLRSARTFLSVGGSWRGLDDLRAGGGKDSHHVLRRLFGLTDEQIRSINGGRQADTGFSQSGYYAKLALRPDKDQNLTVWYQASEMDNVRGYKDLWGGLGRVRSNFAPQRLKFSYMRYETLRVRGLDTLTGTFSVNAQTDGSIRQGLKLTDAITQDDVRVGALGYSVQATTHLTQRHDVAIGGEIYNESIDARRVVMQPQTGAAEQKRALYPDGSQYRTSGLFAQDVLTIVPEKLRAVLGARFTHVRAETFANRNRSDAGRDLGVVDSDERFKDWTYNVGLTWRAAEALNVQFLTGRGFRAPNLNDLGALGLNDLGYEVPASAALANGGLIGASDGEGVLSTGRPVSSLTAERLFNTELGASLRWRRLHSRVHIFDAELKDPIVRRTLVFPLEGLPLSLAGVPVVPMPPNDAQLAQGVASVTTALDPRAVKAFVNEGQTRYYGLDASFNYRLATRWSVDGNYSYLVGHDLNPTRPVRRLPPQQAFLTARYQPGGRLAWIEVGAHVSGAQHELSGGDITDERIGAARRRSDITDFFLGSLVSPYILPGADGRAGTGDDVFGPTNETVAQIRDRVLPLGARIEGVTVVNDGSRVPLYTSTPSFVSINLGGGLIVSKNVRLDVALVNLLDRNYRIHGSGVDAPGAGVYVRLNVRF
jgi:outer membrane receptor protein involved in Fe transport